MRLLKRKHDSMCRPDMTPMIDVVFLLIIFFMTVTQVSKINKDRLELSESTAEQKQDRPEPDVIINVLREGEIRISGKTITTDGLISILSDELRKKGDDPTRLVVLLRADKQGISEGPKEVIRTLRELGIQTVRISYVKEGP